MNKHKWKKLSVKEFYEIVVVSRYPSKTSYRFVMVCERCELSYASYDDDLDEEYYRLLNGLDASDSMYNCVNSFCQL